LLQSAKWTSNLLAVHVHRYLYFSTKLSFERSELLPGGQEERV